MNGAIFSMLARSPIKPIQQHMAKSCECAQELISFFDAVIRLDWDAANTHYEVINRLEHEADEQKKDIRLHLPKGLFLSVPRTDLLELVSRQDRIANRAEDIAGIVIGRKMEIPEPLQELLKVFLTRSVEATAQAEKAVSELDELVETGFRGREVEFVEALINELDCIEHDSDQLEIDMRSKLFSLEKELPPVDVMFLYKVIEWIGDLADHAEKVGNSLELLLAR